MNCEQARNLFDAYLDGELSPSLETELGAHRLACAQCRHQLALMEVAGHVIAADTDDDVALPAEFADRLLACIDTPARVSRRRWQRPIWMVGSALAAAACLAVAFGVWFTRPEVRILGQRGARTDVRGGWTDAREPGAGVREPGADVREPGAGVREPGIDVRGGRIDAAAERETADTMDVTDAELDRALDSVVEQLQSTWTTRAQNTYQLIEFGDMMIMQILDRFGIDEAIEPAEPYEIMPESFDELAPAGPTEDDVEDL